VPSFPGRRISIAEHGATGDGATNDTAAINRAIEACSAAGGGTVVVPAGTFMAASIHLRSHVRLYLSAGATIKGLAEGYDDPEPNAYDKYQDFGHSHFHNALLWGEYLTDVAIEGEGTIDGGGITSGNPREHGGDKQIALRSCQRVLFRGINQVKGGHFFYLLTDVQHLTMENLKMTGGRDAIDLVGVSHANLHDLTILKCGDDTIALKADYSLGKRLRSEDVSVWSSTVDSGCNGLQFGSETAADFRDVRFADIRVLRAGKAGIGLQTNDGGTIENVTFDRITIENAVTPIFINTTRRLRTPEKVEPGRIRHVRIRDVTATAAPSRGYDVFASTISGLPGFPHEDIVLENVTITYPGGGRYDDGKVTPPYPDNYNPRAVGPRPAYGFFIRHAAGLRFLNVKVGFAADDLRPAWVAQDVDGLELERVDARRAPEGAWPSLRLENVRRLRIRGSAPFPETSLESLASGSY
jgi:hypothetical protein